MRVLIADPIAHEGADALQEHGVEVDVRTGLSQERLIADIRDFDGLIVRSETQVAEPVLNAGKQLQVVGRAGVGVDNIDVDAATRLGVTVVNAPSSNTIAAAEHTIALMLSLARHIPQAHGALIGGRWDRRSFLGAELLGKTLGIIGLGRIGAEVARRASAFDMRIVGFDPFVSNEQGRHVGVGLFPFEEVLRQADFLTLHVPLTDATRRLIGADELGKMKQGSFLVNCARGGLVDEEALHQSLQAGDLAGAALDVFAEEPPGENPLLQLPNVVVTPHLGASTAEAQAAVAREVAEQVIDVLKGRTPRYAVNAPLVPPEAYAELAPYIPVALAAGRLASQLVDGQPERLAITYHGGVAQYETAVLRAAVLRGFLERSSEERINLVNASMAAQRRGLHVDEHRTDDMAGSQFGNLLRLDVQASGGETTVAGSLTQNEVHIVQIDTYRVDMVPTGSPWMIVGHTDRPGMIGEIGTITGNNDINIASMQVSRERSRGPAMTVLGLDENLDPEQLDAVKAIRGAERVLVVTL